MLTCDGKAPDFSLPDQSGKNLSLKDFTGKWVIIYFYPKDDTPGCTVEAQKFREAFSEYEKQGIVVLGISKDSVASHRSFHSKYKLPFPILSDEAHRIIEEYGAWQLKKFMGKEFLGTKRMTVIINPEGNVAKIYDNVNPQTHAAEILKDIAAMTVRSAMPMNGI